MPALPPVPGVVAVRYIGTDAADVELGSAVHFHYSGTAPTIAQLQTFGTTVGTSWATNLAPLVDTGFTLTKVLLADLTSPSSATADVTVSHPGTRAGTALPLNVAFTIQELTQLRRRGGHWHIQQRCGVQTDLATPQTWSTSFISSVLSDYLSFVGGIITSGWPGAGTIGTVGVQYYGPPNRTITGSTGRVRTVSTLLATPVVWPVSAFNANARLGSARRRLGKSGG